MQITDDSLVWLNLNNSLWQDPGVLVVGLGRDVPLGIKNWVLIPIFQEKWPIHIPNSPIWDQIWAESEFFMEKFEKSIHTTNLNFVGVIHFQEADFATHVTIHLVGLLILSPPPLLTENTLSYLYGSCTCRYHTLILLLIPMILVPSTLKCKPHAHSIPGWRSLKWVISDRGMPLINGFPLVPVELPVLTVTWVFPLLGSYTFTSHV